MSNFRHIYYWYFSGFFGAYGSREIIGKFERVEAVPCIEFAKRIAYAFGVLQDYLAGE
jgi:hypothetical protein